jgi:hypothetical protein
MRKRLVEFLLALQAPLCQDRQLGANIVPPCLKQALFVLAYLRGDLDKVVEVQAQRDARQAARRDDRSAASREQPLVLDEVALVVIAMVFGGLGLAAAGILRDDRIKAHSRRDGRIA